MTGEVSPTLSTLTGTPDGSGGKVLMTNVPIYAVEPGAASRLGGHVTEEVAPTLRAEMGDNQTAVVYGMSSFDSNAMKSDNPESGIYEADTARTLDLNGGNPACNQGGMMVVQPNEESVDKPIKEITKSYGVTTKGNGDAFISEERHTSLSTGGGEAGQGYPCVLTDKPQSYQEITGTLGARTYQNSSVQEAQTDMFVITPETIAFSQNEREEVRNLEDVAGALAAEPGTHQQTFVAQTFKKDSHAKSSEDGQGWVSTDVNDTLNAFDSGETRTPTLVTQTYQDTTGALCASGYEKNGTQEAANDMYVVQEPMAWDGGQVSSSMLSRDYKDPQCVAIDMGGGKSGCGIHEEKSPTLTTTHGGEPAICGIDTYNLQETGDIGRTVTAAGGGLNEHTPCVYEKSDSTYGVSGTSSKFGVGKDLSPAQTATHPNMVSTTSVVRRLTPLECTRLQGFPDHWVDIGDWVDENGKNHKDSDSPKYKALGNSIALPFWDWMAGRMVAELKRSGVENPTLFSLFSGIGGFEFVYKKHGCEPVASSEIEPFPIAVLKRHFGDDATGEVGDVDQYLR